jgi:translation initiation factor eIF-2B subunit delta
VITDFHELASDNTSGATELIHRLLAVCERDAAECRVEELRAGVDVLEQAHPGMPSFHAVLQILKSGFLPLVAGDGDNAAAIARVASIRNVLTDSGDAIARLFTGLFSSPVRVLTLSRSSTVLAALRLLAERGLLARLAVLESRPMHEGVKTIRDFNRSGVPAALYVDAALQEPLDDADCAVVGADSISADGFLLNKTGSWPLAVCCRERRVPFYVLCDSLKFSPRLRADMLVEEHPAEEIVRRGARDAFAVWNRYYEWVPIDLVTSFVTERGLFPPDRLSQLAGE